MRLKHLLFASALSVASQVHAQAPAWILDTISTESGYLKNVYYSLQNGEVAKVDADNWHIGFSTGLFSASVIVNSADKGVKLYDIGGNVGAFGTDLTTALDNAITTNPMPLYNSNITWEEGAFNKGNANGTLGYGWGDYNTSSHWIVGNRVFGLVTPTDTFQVVIVNKQTAQVPNAPVYNFKIAKINGTNQVVKSITIGSTPDANRYFYYYNIETDMFVSREPARSDWDFVFSNYNDENVVFNNEQYKVFGVVNNEDIRVARVDTPDADFDNIVPSYASFTYDTANNSIGRAWKTSGPNGAVVNDSLCYFIETFNGDIWQLVFTAHNSALASVDPGLVALKKRKVYSNPASVGNVNAAVTAFSVFPNPANGDINVVMDVKDKSGNTQMLISDISGRIVYRGTVNVNTGLNAYYINSASFAPGTYVVALSNGSWKVAEKLVVQH